MHWRYLRHKIGLRMLVWGGKLMKAKISVDKIGKDQNLLDYRIFTVEVPVRREFSEHEPVHSVSADRGYDEKAEKGQGQKGQEAQKDR